MISDELKESLKEILNLIPVDEQHKEIYESDIASNKKLYDYIDEATKNRKGFFYISRNDNDLKNALFMSSSSNLNLAYINVTKKIVIKVAVIKELLNT